MDETFETVWGRLTERERHMVQRHFDVEPMVALEVELDSVSSRVSDTIPCPAPQAEEADAAA